MKRFAVIEDDVATSSQLNEYIMRFSEEIEGRKAEVSVSVFHSAEDFLRNNLSFDAIFLDINLPGIDGFSCAKKIRETNEDIILMFVTSLSQFAIRGYEVNALDYVVKPLIYSDFQQKLKRVYKKLNERVNRIYRISLPNGMLNISFDDLMYVEVTGHTLIYHLRDRNVEQYGKLSEIEKIVTPLGFIRCNRCYIVNPKHVNEVKDNVVLIGSEALRISRPQKKAFLTALNAWLAKEGG